MFPKSSGIFQPISSLHFPARFLDEFEWMTLSDHMLNDLPVDVFVKLVQPFLHMAAGKFREDGAILHILRPWLAN